MESVQSTHNAALAVEGAIEANQMTTLDGSELKMEGYHLKIEMLQLCLFVIMPTHSLIIWKNVKLNKYT